LCGEVVGEWLYRKNKQQNSFPFFLTGERPETSAFLKKFIFTSPHFLFTAVLMKLQRA
jgi:hypothetical protein